MSNPSVAADSPKDERPEILDTMATSWVWLGGLLLIYMVLGYYTKTLVMTWTNGPLFPLLFLYVIPRTVWNLKQRFVARRNAR